MISKAMFQPRSLKNITTLTLVVLPDGSMMTLWMLQPYVSLVLQDTFEVLFNLQR